MNFDPENENGVELDVDKPIWPNFFTVAPLVLIGTKEGDHYNLAPKHMVTPLGQGHYFGFVCTPEHRTYHNVKQASAFAVSYPRPDQVVLASLAATARDESCTLPKPVVDELPTTRASKIDAPLLEAAYLVLECKLDRIVDGFGKYSLIAGRIVRAAVDRSAYRHSDQDEQELISRNPLLAFLPGGRFAEIRETLVFPYPKEFKE